MRHDRYEMACPFCPHCQEEQNRYEMEMEAQADQEAYEAEMDAKAQAEEAEAEAKAKEEEAHNDPRR